MLTERIFNWLIGFSVLSWAVAGLIDAAPEERFTLVRLTTSGINAVVGALFVARSPLVLRAPFRALAAALPSIPVAGAALHFSSPFYSWPLHAQLLFVAGAVVAVVSLLALGRSFALLPGVRTVVIRGPFRLIRHPAYAGELLMIASCTLAAPCWQTALVLVAALPLVVVRIKAEESVLLGDQAYRQYQAKVPWRLLPGLW